MESVTKAIAKRAHIVPECGQLRDVEHALGKVDDRDLPALAHTAHMASGIKRDGETRMLPPLGGFLNNILHKRTALEARLGCSAEASRCAYARLVQ